MRTIYRIILPQDGSTSTGVTVMWQASKMHIKGDPAVSERHAVIAWAPDGWTLADVGSSNGTLVNGERLEADGGQLILELAKPVVGIV